MTEPKIKRTKAELARLLGLDVSAIVTRKEAADILNTVKGTLANKAGTFKSSGENKELAPRYWRSTDSKSAGLSWYIRAEVEAYRDDPRSLARDQYGKKPWPTLSVHPVDIADKFYDEELRSRALAYRLGAVRQITESAFYAGRHISADLLRAHRYDEEPLASELQTLARKVTAQADPDPYVSKHLHDRLKRLYAMEDEWMSGDTRTLPK